jgi:hypothetical protein
MTTPPEESLNATLATETGPGFTRTTANPCPGLQYSRRARPFRHVAMAVPPADVSSLPASIVAGAADF